MNPATFLRVLGPEPWNVAYVEPSIRPDDGRYGENPNRFQQHYQYQVILKPDPGNPQEIYLESLAALGLDPREHDIRFVEDNWESPALGAWGLGWEVWAGRAGDHPVHLLPAGRRPAHRPGVGGADLRPGAHPDRAAQRLRRHLERAVDGRHHLWRRAAPGRVGAQQVLLRDRRRRAAARDVRAVRGGVEGGAGERAGAAGLRLPAQMLAHLQRARHARRHRRHRAPGLLRPHARPGAPGVRSLPGAAAAAGISAAEGRGTQAASREG